MTIRTRITVVATAAVAGVGLLVAGLFYVAEVRDLRGQVDIDLRERAAAIASELLESGEVDPLVRPRFGQTLAYAQVVGEDGTVISLAPGSPALPIEDRTLRVAGATSSRFYSSVDVETVHLRMLTIPLRPGSALQVARPVDEIDLHLLHVAGIIGLITLSALAVAVVLGRLIATTALRPVARLTEAAERVAATRDLAHRVEVSGDTELDRLAASMNSMVAALDASLTAQRHLVADASHELQTPLTVIRTNLEVLGRVGELAPDERRHLLADVNAELENLSRLVTNLVDLARETADGADRQPVELDEIVGSVVNWAERAFPGVAFEVQVEPFEVEADPDQAERMVRNLVENAARWNGSGGPVEIRLGGGALEVRDHGPGIDPDDLAFVFERFYRARSAQPLPGSGLGLAIVRKAAIEHGWTASAGNAPDGGAVFRVEMPVRTSPAEGGLRLAPTVGGPT